MALPSEEIAPVGSHGRPVKAAELVADALRRRIATGELAPGHRLPPEDRLMEEYDLARTTLREALRILESEGIIMVQRGRQGGPRVTRPPIRRLARGLALHLQLEGTTLSDLDSALQLIEPPLAANLANARTDEDLDALEEVIAAAATAARQGDRVAFAQAVAGVHELLYERGGNTTLAIVARALHEVIDEYYRIAAQQASDELLQRAVRSYRRFRRFVEDGDAEGAAEHWRQQLAFTTASLSARFDGDAKLEVFSRTEP